MLLKKRALGFNSAFILILNCFKNYLYLIEIDRPLLLFCRKKQGRPLIQRMKFTILNLRKAPKVGIVTGITQQQLIQKM